jgi:hypothetical protein
MTGLLSLGATAILAALAAWVVGGWVLRSAGAFLALGGLVCTATTGSPTTALAAVLGTIAWLAGHWLYAARHHCFRTPLARRVFLKALPSRVDPTRGWGRPNGQTGNATMPMTSSHPPVLAEEYVTIACAGVGDNRDDRRHRARQLLFQGRFAEAFRIDPRMGL